MKEHPRARRAVAVSAGTAIVAAGILAGTAQSEPPPDAKAAALPPGFAAAMARSGGNGDFKDFEEVTKDLEKVISTTDGSSPLYELYKDEDTGKLLAVLPPDYASQLVMIACTVSGGDPQAGVMGPTYYAKWKKIDKQLALIEPNFQARTDGDKQAKDSIERLFTDRVILSLPILSMKGPRPVIDLGNMATTQTSRFFGPGGGFGPSLFAINPQLASLTKAKAFPENIIFEYEAPNQTGRLTRFTFNFGKLDGTPGFKPRKADNRVGYFYNFHQDYARIATEDVTERYINRWNLEKADPSLKVSIPKEPIVWYIEHTTPIKFRRYVRDGIEMWNDAFEEVGIVNALEVRQQDSETGAYMDLDPEDARYNFFRWNASNQGYAIGPSRTNPYTGEILDADVVWHQGLTRAVRNMYASISDMTEDVFGPQALAWFDENPSWDPRLRLAPPARREQLRLQRQLNIEKVVSEELESESHPWTHGLNDPTGTACRIGDRLALDISLASFAFHSDLLGPEGKGDDKDDEEGESDGEEGDGEKDPSVEMLEGLPEEFIGGMIRYIAAHEVGHCLGLQHNMAASSIRTLDEINSDGYEGATIGSVMDYCAPNINHGTRHGDVQGPYATPVVGPYDRWAIAYGYGPENKLDEVLKQSSDPDHIFLSQIAIMVGSDPRNQTWELGKDNLNFAESRLDLIQELRGKLLDELVEDGESWAVARRRYETLLGNHIQSLVVAMPYIGGSYASNDHKGTPDASPPIEDVPAEKQRRALHFIIDNAFEDEAFGLTPEMVRYFGKEHWWDPSGFDELLSDPSYDVHDMVAGVQALALTIIMNPMTLSQVYDNEYRTLGEQDTLTVAEVVSAVTDNVWRECRDPDDGDYSPSHPMISSFRRNLQAEHLGRLIDLALLPDSMSPTIRTISTLAKNELREIADDIENARNAGPDPYSDAHLTDSLVRIERALDAAYVINR